MLANKPKKVNFEEEKIGNFIKKKTKNYFLNSEQRTNLSFDQRLKFGV